MASPLDNILATINKRAEARAQEPAAVVPPEVTAQEALYAKQREAARLFRERVRRHLQRLLVDPKLKWTQYPPMDQFHRLVVASEADDAGLVSHEFGEEEIDRYIIVYKEEHAPSPEEVARLTLKHTHKLADESVQRILAGPAAEEPQPQRQRKTSKSALPVDEVADELPVEALHAVGTVKRVRRNAGDAMEEVRRKKRLETLAKGGSGEPRAADEHEQWDEEEEF